jgi:hypothetical protein
MRFGLYRTRERGPDNKPGGVPVEFEFRLQRFLLLILGIVDSDRLCSVRQIGSDLSRRDARHGSRSYQSTHPFKKLNFFHSKYPLNFSADMATTLAGIKPLSSLCLEPLLGSEKTAGCEP